MFPALWNFKSFPHTCKEARGRLWTHTPGGSPAVAAECAPLSEPVTPGSSTPPGQAVLQNYRHRCEDGSNTRPGSDSLRVPGGLRCGALSRSLHLHTRPRGPRRGVWMSLLWVRISTLLLFTESLSKIPPQFTPPVQRLPPHQCAMVSDCGQVWEAFLITVLICFQLNTGSFSTGRSYFSSRLKSFTHFYLVICLFLTDLEELVTHSGH